MKTICLDFDGVCHAYVTPWSGATAIPDSYVPGLFEFLEAVAPHFEEIAIFSSRSHEPGGIAAMQAWFEKQYRIWCQRTGRKPNRTPYLLSFPTVKPPFTVGLDDRVLTFRGVFPSLEEVLSFRPWNK